MEASFADSATQSEEVAEVMSEEVIDVVFLGSIRVLGLPLLGLLTIGPRLRCKPFWSTGGFVVTAATTESDTLQQADVPLVHRKMPSTYK